MEKTRRKAITLPAGGTRQALDAGFSETVTTGGAVGLASAAHQPVNANMEAYRERMKRRDVSTCPACGAHSDMGDNYCRMCGKSVTSTCRSCGQALPK